MGFVCKACGKKSTKKKVCCGDDMFDESEVPAEEIGHELNFDDEDEDKEEDEDDEEEEDIFDDE